MKKSSKGQTAFSSHKSEMGAKEKDLFANQRRATKPQMKMVHKIEAKKVSDQSTGCYILSLSSDAI